MIELPELDKIEAKGAYFQPAWYVSAKGTSPFWLTEAQANEIIRRCKAYEGLVRALEEIADESEDHGFFAQEALTKAKPPCPSCKDSGLKTDENGAVEDDVCPECNGENDA